MATNMVFYCVSNVMLDFLQGNPDYLNCYVEGRRPQAKKSFVDKVLRRDVVITVPEGWPEIAPKSFEPEISSGMLESFHYVLNGSKEFVSHTGCVFQTWLSADYDSVALVIDSESFAFKEAEVVGFKKLLESVYPDKAIDRYMEVSGVDQISPVDNEFLEDAFKELVAVCDFALSHKRGLLWCAC